MLAVAQLLMFFNINIDRDRLRAATALNIIFTCFSSRVQSALNSLHIHIANVDMLHFTMTLNAQNYDSDAL